MKIGKLIRIHEIEPENIEKIRNPKEVTTPFPQPIPDKKVPAEV